MGPPPAAASLSRAEAASLRAIVDALLPAHPVPDSQPRTKANEMYWEHQLASDPAFLQALEVSVLSKLSETDRWLTRFLLWLLSSPAGTALVLGTPTLVPFSKWPLVAEQTAALRILQYSSVLARRQAFASLKRLVCGLAFSYTVSGRNPHWDAIGYPGAPHLSSAGMVSPTEDTHRTLAASGQQASVQQAVIRHGDVGEYLDCDVLIVGSGAGGCVAASVLSRAGYRVLVVDKGSYVPPVEHTNLEAEAYDRLYESHGLLTTADKSIMILAGSTVGGGTAVNWSCALPLPNRIREEWSTGHGLDAFAPNGEYDKALNYVLIKTGAIERGKVSHNPNNRKLQQGCDVLGYAWETTGVNVRETADPTVGYIGFGDRYGFKNDGVSVFLRDAVKHGAQILDDCQVTRIRTRKADPPASGVNGDHDDGVDVPDRGPRATGAECVLTRSDGSGRQNVYISARRSVVVAAGALHTPCLLRRSGLRNWNIGRHLRLHPVTAVMGFAKQSEKIDCFLGAPLTTVCNEFELGPLHDGYGAKIECPSAHPGLLAAGVPWTSAYQFKERMNRLRQAVPLIVIQRDSGEGGRVRLARDGRTPVVDYTLNDADKKSMQEAVVGGLKVLITGGAQVVQSSSIRDTGLTLNGKRYGLLQLAGDEQVQSYLDFVSRQGMKRHEVGLFSAHQMGSCRMSASPLTGAVDANGETWDCNNLFVMDASTFPTASGVNPMITIFAIAKMLSSRLALRLRYEDKRPTGMAETVRAQELVARRKEMRTSTATDIWRTRIWSLFPFRSVPQAVLWIAVLLSILFGLLFAKRDPVAIIPPPPAPSVVSTLHIPEAITNAIPDYETVESWFESDTPWFDRMNTSSIWPYSVMWTALFFPIMVARGGQ